MTSHSPARMFRASRASVAADTAIAQLSGMRSTADFTEARIFVQASVTRSAAIRRPAFSATSISRSSASANSLRRRASFCEILAD